MSAEVRALPTGGSGRGKRARAGAYTPTDKSGQPAYTPADISGQVPPATLPQVRATYRRWFGDTYDLDALDCVLSAAAAERLDGDPPWLLVVGGSGAAKTESIAPLAASGAHVVSTINGEAALLSGTSKNERSKSATGGLLRTIGERGTLVIKDVTSILSMNRDSRALVLAALREVYDGEWSRNVGTDGGATLRWKGRVVVIGAVTTAWDAAHAVIATMGDRFLLVRLDSTGGANRRAAGRQSLSNVGHEVEMRAELARTVAGLLNTVDGLRVMPLTEHDADRLMEVADVVTLARTAVERDFQGEPQFAHEPEMPTRFAKQLMQVARGGMALGMSHDDALNRALRCAGDSMPPIRYRVLLDVAAHPLSAVSDTAERVQLPRKTVDRTMRELHLLELLRVDLAPWGASTRPMYSLGDGATVAALDALRLARFVRGAPGVSA
jgi:hypothetical protein